MPTRRDFLRVSASAGLALAAAPSLVQAAKDEKKEFAGFSIGLQSYSLRKFSTDDAIKYAKEMGFEHMEFFNGQFPVTSTPEQIDAFKDKVKAAGLKMYSHGVNRFTKDDAANRKLFEFAKRAGHGESHHSRPHARLFCESRRSGRRIRYPHRNPQSRS